MDPETEKIIKEQMEKLPEEVKKLFTDPGMGDKIINIGKKNWLNVEQLGILQTETFLVMLGLVHPDEFRDELKNRLNINVEKANGIITDINLEILSGIREKLKETYEKTDEIDAGEEKNPTPSIKKQETYQPVSHDEEEERKNTQVLKAAGIEITNGNEKKETLPEPEKLELTTPEKPASALLHVMPKKEIYPVKSPEGSQGASASNGISPVFAQKLAGFFQIPSVKTEHTLDNITKTGASESTKTGQSRIDPYREIPE